ncbi:ATP-binding protein [Sphingomonas sp.]|uniref:ATP-binding protein n=1 Tax=Sphingomonas sp. TaxID=28214 RepID=UPI002ED7DE8F
MTERTRLSFGLLGRVFAILLLAIAIEFAVSTLLYERAGQIRVREEEAHRVAENLAIASSLMNAHPRGQRAQLAKRLSRETFIVKWHPTPVPPVPLAAELGEMRAQIVNWEPALARRDLHLHLKSPGHSGIVMGQLDLDDGSWLEFKATQLVHPSKLRFNRFLLALIPAVALILIGGLLLRRVLAPMRMLARAAERIGQGERVVLTEMGVSEIRRVVRAFNEMQARIHQLIFDRTEALASVGHDLRTPLARLQLRAEGIEDPVLRTAIAKDVDEMEAMVASLLAFYGGDSDPEKPAQTDVAILVQTIVDDATDMGHPAQYSGPDHLEATLRPGALKRAVGNLVENAIKYADGAQVSLEATNDRIIVRVQDNGVGIPEEELLHVLEPFVRLDLARSRDTYGLGLGIPIAHRFALREGGVLRLTNRPSGGLRAELDLPRHAPRR